MKKKIKKTEPDIVKIKYDALMAIKIALKEGLRLAKDAKNVPAQMMFELAHSWAKIEK